MAHGLPDFGVSATKETISGLADLAELAARLGSIVTFDRRGDVVWVDDFENDLSAWYKDGGGADRDAYVCADTARNGAFSCKLITGSGGYGSIMITHNGGGLVLSKIGVEVSFTLHADLDELRVRFLYYDGEDYEDAEIRFVSPPNELRYKDTEGDFIAFATGVTLSASSHLFHTLKFLIDLPNKKYNRVILNNVTYDLSDKDVKTDTSIVYPRYGISITTQVIADSNVTSYIDDVILTQNEP